MKVLAVDDDPVFLGLFSNVLLSHGVVDLTLAQSGPQALTLLHSARPRFDCIFCDIQMPEMNGIELVGILRALDPSRDTQIVMVTGMSERKFVDNAFRAGADDFVSKPIDGIEFKARFSTILRVNEERQKARDAQAALTAANSRQHVFDFEETFPLPDVPNAMPFMAMRNYLKTVGILHYAISQAIGVTVENAANIFVRTNDEEFRGIMADVAETVIEVIKQQDLIISYAGSGDFFCMTSALHVPPVDDLEMMINDSLASYASSYPAGCHPIVHVGRASRQVVFSRRNVDDLIDSALTSARARSTRQHFALRRIA